MNYGLSEILFRSTDLLLRGDWLIALNNGPQEVVGQEGVQEAVTPVDGAGQVADQAGAQPGFLAEFFGNPLNLILLSGVLFVMLVLRPQQKQMKQMKAALAGLKKNDKVITASGIHGTVVQANADESTVILRIDDNSGARMTVNRDAISKIINSETKE